MSKKTSAFRPEVNGPILEISEAISIMGKSKVISADRSINIWARKTKLPYSNNVHQIIRYQQETLLSCAEENSYHASWNLIYLPNLSLFNMTQIFKAGSGSIPNFTRSSKWIRQKDQTWSRQALPAGYYLINLMPRYVNMLPSDRLKLLSQELAPELTPATPAQFGLAYFTKLLVNPECDRPNFYHISTDIAQNDQFITIGNYTDNNGMDINTVRDIRPNNQSVNHGITLIRNHDF